MRGRRDLQFNTDDNELIKVMITYDTESLTR